MNSQTSSLDSIIRTAFDAPHHTPTSLTQSGKLFGQQLTGVNWPAISVPTFDTSLKTEKIVFSEDIIYGNANSQRRAIDQLMDFSESANHSAQLMHGVSFEFKTWGNDTRELFDVPPVRNLIRSISRQWPYWLHFCEPSPAIYAVLALSLCEPVGMASKSRFSLHERFVSVHDLFAHLFKLIRASVVLQQSHSLATEHRAVHRQRVTQAVQDMIATSE